MSREDLAANHEKYGIYVMLSSLDVLPPYTGISSCPRTVPTGSYANPENRFLKPQCEATSQVLKLSPTIGPAVAQCNAWRTIQIDTIQGVQVFKTEEMQENILLRIAAVTKSTLETEAGEVRNLEALYRASPRTPNSTQNSFGWKMKLKVGRKHCKGPGALEKVDNVIAMDCLVYSA